MRLHPTVAPFVATLLLGGMSLASARAASLLLDFGPTAVTSADATKSPAFAAGAVPSTQTSWNTITADASTLVYSDGTAAAGVSIDLGRSAAGVDTIDFNDNGFTVSALGGSINSGIYAGTSPVKGGIFGGSGSGNNLALGVRINGLAAGTYSVYVHGRNTSGSSATPERFYAKAGSSASTYAFSTGDLNTLVANSSPANTTSFVLGDNYGKLLVTLTAGQSLFLACEGTTGTELRGFFNTIEVVPATAADLAPKISPQPAAALTVLEGAPSVTISAQAQSQFPVFRQWQLNGVALAGATNDTLTLSNISLGMAGTYNLFATNAYGSALSSNCVLTVTPVFNTPQMSNIWNIYADQRVYMNPTNHTERGLAYNPVTGNLLLVSRSPSESVVVLDPATGAEKHFLGVGGVPGSSAGQSLGLNMIGVADDGVVYAASVAVNTWTTPFYLYRWNNDSPGTDPVQVFGPSGGDPGAMTEPGLRYGDNMAVRGAGANTQILLAPDKGTNVVLLRTTTGMDFQNEVAPTMIAISGVPSGFAQTGLAWGPGNNTFWAKSANIAQLFLVQFDLNAKTGAVLHAYSTSAMSGSVRGIGADKTQKWLAGISLQSLDSVRLFDISDLNRGPLLSDEELYAVKNANITVNGAAFTAFGGNYLFALDCNNGLKAFLINTNYSVTSPMITTQPVGQTIKETMASVSFGVTALGAEPLAYQWRFNGTDIAGATTSVLTLSNITASMAGVYSVLVTNTYGSALSSNATLTVLPVLSTAQTTNLWNLLPGERPYLGLNSTERGLAYNRATKNLLLVSRSPAESVVVLDPATGAEKRFLNTAGIPGSMANVSLGLNQVQVADDGAIYGCGVSVVASTTPLGVYRWANDSADTYWAPVFMGDPGDGVEPGLRWGDNLAVRGAGADTQILLAPATGTNVVLLRTTTGSSETDFQWTVPPAVIAVSGVPSGFAALGVAFGPGTNTFWAKNAGNALYLIQFDLAASTGAVLYAYTNPATLTPVRGIATDATQKWLAGVALDNPDSVNLYDITDLAAGPVLRDQKLFTVKNPNGTAGGTAAAAFGDDYLFVLDTNNGIKAFKIDPNYVASLASFQITGVVRNGSDLVLNWPSVSGHTYQVQSKDTVSAGTWSNLGSPLTGTGATLSFTNSTTSAATRFYRIVGQ